MEMSTLMAKVKTMAPNQPPPSMASCHGPWQGMASQIKSTKAIFHRGCAAVLCHSTKKIRSLSASPKFSRCSWIISAISKGLPWPALASHFPIVDTRRQNLGPPSLPIISAAAQIEAGDRDVLSSNDPKSSSSSSSFAVAVGPSEEATLRLPCRAQNQGAG